MRLLFAVAFVALTAALFLTETRAALAGLALGCFVSVLMLAGKRSRIWAIAGAGGPGAGIGAVDSPHARGAVAGQRTIPERNFRTMMWEDGLRLIGQHPWFGVGMETIRNHWIGMEYPGIHLFPR